MNAPRMLASCEPVEGRQLRVACFQRKMRRLLRQIIEPCAAAPSLAHLGAACNVPAPQKGAGRRANPSHASFPKEACTKLASRDAYCRRSSGSDHHMKFLNFLGLAGAAAISLGLATGAMAADTVKIGAVMPMSGGAASIGVHAKAAFDVVMDIVNNAHPELGNFPLAKNAGLAGLGGAKVDVVFADNQGSPATGQNQTLRLITEGKVVALTGAYQSGITLTSSAIVEKYGIPYVNGESVAANLTERGFKWFFRTTPIASDFAKIYVDFLTDMKAQGGKIDSIALVHDNT